MAGTTDARLTELGLTLPKAATPAFNSVPDTTAGQLVFVAGQIPQWEGEVRAREAANESFRRAGLGARVLTKRVGAHGA